MKVKLFKKPKNPTIVEGFPGFGLIGTITTEFLIEQLKAELIGYMKLDEIPAMVAIHDSKVVNPIGVFYDEKNNIVIFHVVTSVQNIEWQLAEAISKLAKEVEAKEIISLEGVATPGGVEGESKTFYYANDDKNIKKFESASIEKLKEGIIIGVTGALLLEEDTPVSCVFVETASGMPDSKASAEVVKVLDKYLNLNIDPNPLLEQAKKFENKLQKILEQTKHATSEKDKKALSYVG